MTGRFGAATRAGLGAKLLAFTFLGACALIGPQAPDTRPVPRPSAPALPSEPSPGSDAQASAIARHFAKVEQDLLGRGLLRQDGGGPDTPWGARELTENFVRIALHDEYTSSGGRLVAGQTAAPLRRWQSPIRIGLRFGASVSEAQRATDRATLDEVVRRLASATGHPIRVSEQNPNYWVYIVSEDERLAKGAEWAALFPGLRESDLRAATHMDLSTFCMVLAISPGASPVYSGALAVIRAELPPVLRTSCLHEELAQGLGLANDHYQARPSIFNDDEEFATLTRMDETLLKILYDRRLTAGLRADEARPILQEIVAELLPGES